MGCVDIERFRGRTDRVPEAEVALNLALHLVRHPLSAPTVEVSIDGAQVNVAGEPIFRISDFLQSQGWRQTEKIGRVDWSGVYEKGGLRLRVDSKPGKADVRARVGQRRVIAECKGGPVGGRRGNPEYPRLRQAVGQLVTMEEAYDGDILVVAVPNTESFKRRVEDFQKRPLVARLGIRFVLVDEHGLYPDIA